MYPGLLKFNVDYQGDLYLGAHQIPSRMLMYRTAYGNVYTNKNNHDFEIGDYAILYTVRNQESYLIINRIYQCTHVGEKYGKKYYTFLEFKRNQNKLENTEKIKERFIYQTLPLSKDGLKEWQKGLPIEIKYPEYNESNVVIKKKTQKPYQPRMPETKTDTDYNSDVSDTTTDSNISDIDHIIEVDIKELEKELQAKAQANTQPESKSEPLPDSNNKETSQVSSEEKPEDKSDEVIPKETPVIIPSDSPDKNSDSSSEETNKITPESYIDSPLISQYDHVLNTEQEGGTRGHDKYLKKYLKYRKKVEKLEKELGITN